MFLPYPPSHFLFPPGEEPPPSLSGTVDFSPLLSDYRAKSRSLLEATAEDRRRWLAAQGVVVVDITAVRDFPKPQEEEEEKEG